MSNLQVGIINQIQKHEQRRLKKEASKCPMLFESEILGGSGQKKLLELIGLRNQCHFTLLARATEDDFDADFIKKSCQKKGRTLTIARSIPHGRVFGAFTDTTREDGQYESYLYCMTNTEKAFE